MLDLFSKIFTIVNIMRLHNVFLQKSEITTYQCHHLWVEFQENNNNTSPNECAISK